MAITYTKRQEELANQQQPVTSNKSYNGMKGVSENTANNLGNYQQGYKPSEQTQKAQNYAEQVQAQKPQTYSSKYQPQLDSILQQIQDPDKFKYEFNGDEMFKYYADLYAQNGKQAAMDVMGQAAGLTGGYGNSYGQQVAQQQYQEYMRPLYDKGLELQNAAYQRYRDQLGDLQNAYNYTQNAENNAYNMYRDQLGDWQTERDWATGRADTERNFDYNEYNNGLDYWNALAQNEANLAETQRQYDTNLAANYATSILANGQIPSLELLQAAGLSLEDAQKLVAQLTGGGGSGKKDDTYDKMMQYLALMGKEGNSNKLALMQAAAQNQIGNVRPEEIKDANIQDTLDVVYPSNGKTVDLVSTAYGNETNPRSPKITTATYSQQQYEKMIRDALNENLKKQVK